MAKLFISSWYDTGCDCLMLYLFFLAFAAGFFVRVVLAPGGFQFDKLFALAALILVILIFFLEKKEFEVVEKYHNWHQKQLTQGD